ncbi:unnamed protein product [Adineta ricciae]|uniref:PiggyBac transposable element-derived protein domain-containing protein n=1 Tax=Adineta ricciae TaxID=249248 RepID=A0A815TVF0_ADIRI|nr:unnamed protein product [Adineta ricciae]CAF1509127.1 unnamed protein product [Adineta ricciae]
MSSWIDDESDDEDFYDQYIGSETENAESQTSEEDDEIDLENLKLDDDSTERSLYSSKSGITWSSIPSSSTKISSSNDTNEKTGPTGFTENVSSIEDSFMCFMSEKIIRKILIYSNMEHIRNTTSNEKTEEITMMEIKAFIGLLLLGGLLGKSKKSIRSIWRRNPLESPIFKATMSRERFEKIISCLRFDDKTTREGRGKSDKFAAIRTDVTIDELLLGFRVKCPFRQFIPKKHDKYGLKFWLCVDVDSYYVLNAFPYIGRQPHQERQTQIGASVVLELLLPLYDSNRNVSIDNFFTSVPLVKELQMKNLTLIGTLRKNKPEIPIEFQSNRKREIGPSLFGFHGGLTLASFVHKQNKAALLLCSKHHDNQVNMKNGKPIIVLDYNKTKGTVDTVDQMCHKYTAKRGTRRWPLCVFYGMIDIAAINALIVWKAKNPQWNQNKKFQRRLFLEELGLSLVSNLLDFRSKTSKFLNKDVENALAIVGYPMVKNLQEPEPNENSIQPKKRKRC